MPMSRKENEVYQYNRHDDHKELRNRRSNTFVMQYLRDAPNHYPLTVQTDRRYKPIQAKRKEKNKHGLKAKEESTEIFYKVNEPSADL